MNMTSLHPCSVGLRCWGAGLAFMLEPRRGVSGPTFAFAVGSFLMGVQTMGPAPLTSSDVHSCPSLLAVDIAPSPVLGGQYTSELAGGGHLHTRKPPWSWPLGGTSMPFPRILMSSGPTAQSAVIHLVVVVKVALEIEVGGCAGAEAATLHCG
jgi:hypothetical protein